MNLAATQAAFMAHLTEEDLALPPEWQGRFAAGLEVYRNAYRTRLVDSLRETFARTAQWIGDDAFVAAAAHHFITNPPRGWTLDLAGEGFVEVLAELFANDPEVAELGWLEWTMHRLFVAEDALALDRAAFLKQVRQLDEDGWMDLRLRFVPALAVRPVTTQCAAIWRSLAEGKAPPQEFLLAERMHLLVWREGLSPVFRQVSAGECRALQLLRGGGSYGDACQLLVTMLGEAEAVATAGAMLARWVDDGMVAGTIISRAG